MHILIYGTSTQALHFLPALALNYTLLGFVDSDPAKQGTRWMNRPVYHPGQLGELKFDQILIASCFIDEINQTLASYGIAPGIAVTKLDAIQQTSREYERALQAVRSKAEDRLPKIPLQWQHIAGATLLTDAKPYSSSCPSRASSPSWGGGRGF